MKKILILSDTHSYIDDEIIKFCKTVDQVWHAGDIGKRQVTDAIKEHTSLKAVYGNIDAKEIREEFSEELYFNCEAVSVLMTHIGGYPNAYPKIIKDKLEQTKPKLFICGHSHILKVIWDKKHNLLHINPGAIGHYGIHKVRTMIRIEIDNDKIKNLEIIETKRTQ